VTGSSEVQCIIDSYGTVSFTEMPISTSREVSSLAVHALGGVALNAQRHAHRAFILRGAHEH